MAAKTFLTTDLLLIGPNEDANLATGNSILGSKIFDNIHSCSSVESTLEFDVALVCDRIITVVITAGFCDTENNEYLTSLLEIAIAANPRGYHAILFVFKYRQRYTKETEKTIAFLKQYLGDDFINKHTIIILSGGDDFEMDGNSRDDYEAWCREQSGALRHLFEECCFRSVLFNNRTRDEKVLTAQRDALLRIIDTSLQGKRYDNALFKQAQNIEERVIKEEGGSKVSREMLCSCSLISQNVERLRNPEKDGRSKVRERILEETSALRQMAVEKLKNSPELDDLVGFTKMVEMIITEEDDGETKIVETKSKTMPLTTPSKKSAIGLLIANEQTSKFELNHQRVLLGTYQQLKNSYIIEVTNKIASILHERLSKSKA